MDERDTHIENNEPSNEPDEGSTETFDFSFVSSTARIALYDDLRSAPRVTEIQPAETGAYIDNLATTVYTQSQTAGGSIPYTVIREVSENFIHARFQEVVVSILDKGNTIRFADHGPGIACKEKAQMPGFSSAIEPMKGYIRGVGSGLPIVKEYLEFSHGSISIEDNLGSGSVVTISLTGDEAQSHEDDSGYEFDDQMLTETPHPFDAAAAQQGFSAPTQPGYPPFDQQGYPISVQQGYPAVANPGYPVSLHQDSYPGAGSFNQGYYPNQMQVAPTMTEVPYPHQYGFNQPTPFSAPTQGQPYQAAQGGAFPGVQSHPYEQPYMAPYQTGHTPSPSVMKPAASALSEKEQAILALLYNEGCLGVTDIARILDLAGSTTHATLKKLEQAGFVVKNSNQKREITQLGRAAVESTL